MAVQREHPVLARQRQVLHHLAFDALEIVDAAGIAVVADLVEAAAAGVARRRPPVEAETRGAVPVGRIEPERGCRQLGEHRLDRRPRAAGRRPGRVVLVHRAALQAQVGQRSPGDLAAAVGLRHAEAGRGFRRIDPQAVERDVGRVTPAGPRVQVEASAGVVPRIGAELEQPVVPDRLQHLGVPVGVVAVVAAIAGAQREAAAGIDAAEQRVEAARLVDQLVLHPLEGALGAGRHPRLQVLGLPRLLRGDGIRA